MHTAELRARYRAIKKMADSLNTIYLTIKDQSGSANLAHTDLAMAQICKLYKEYQTWPRLELPLLIKEDLTLYKATLNAKQRLMNNFRALLPVSFFQDSYQTISSAQWGHICSNTYLVKMYHTFELQRAHDQAVSTVTHVPLPGIKHEKKRAAKFIEKLPKHRAALTYWQTEDLTALETYWVDVLLDNIHFFEATVTVYKFQSMPPLEPSIAERKAEYKLKLQQFIQKKAEKAEQSKAKTAVNNTGMYEEKHEGSTAALTTSKFLTIDYNRKCEPTVSKGPFTVRSVVLAPLRR